MYIICVKGVEIASFMNVHDAEHFVIWKKESMAADYSKKLVNDYLEKNPITNYGVKTLPGDVPLSVTYPAYETYVEELEKIVTIEEK